MKKILLSLLAIIAMSANAQTNLLVNGDFETWADGQPTNWKSVSSASSATLSQSTDAHAGSYSVSVSGKKSTNTRLAYKELNLKKGTYTFKFYAKCTRTDSITQVKGGYTPVSKGVAGSYNYAKSYTNLKNTEWTEVSYEFTLTDDAQVCIIVMNAKSNANYGVAAQSILVDDASLTTTDGGINENAEPEKTIENTPETAYTVAEAVKLIEAGEWLTCTVYVKGIISKVDSYNNTYGSITYWLSDDGTTTSQQFECYGGLNIGGAKFTSVEDLSVGSTVVVKGIMKKYTPKEGDPVYEFDKNNEIVSISSSIAAVETEAAVADKTCKVIENGQIVIVKGGKKFNVAGAALN